MILRDGTVISHETAGYKFDHDPMAEFLHYLSLDGGQDRDAGDVEHSTGWFAQFGKRMLHADNSGFVWCYRHDNVEAATEDFDTAEARWIDSLNDVTCTECDTHFGSDEGMCWCCGARSYVERVR
jgi:hypothetical protein